MLVVDAVLNKTKRGGTELKYIPRGNQIHKAQIQIEQPKER
jgi:hypothetical protein